MDKMSQMDKIVLKVCDHRAKCGEYNPGEISHTF